jgi:hypothetical protein
LDSAVRKGFVGLPFDKLLRLDSSAFNLAFDAEHALLINEESSSVSICAFD